MHASGGSVQLSTARDTLTSQQTVHYDVVFVGGGLHHALAALALRVEHPRLRIALLEAQTLCGNHTWCFHAGDRPPQVGAWFGRLPLLEWPGYDVRFPGFERQLHLPYHCLSAPALRDTLLAAFAGAEHCSLREHCPVDEVSADEVRCADGSIYRAGRVFEARGPGDPSAAAGYQKFVGLELRVASGRVPRRPVLMDARVPQHGDFRFFYLLPLAPDRVLVEDTRFSRTPDLDADAAARAVRDYARRAGLTIDEELRTEQGVLPMPWRGAPPAPQAPVQLGYAGGWFHPATGYSMPCALAVAQVLATHWQAPDAGLGALWRSHRRQHRFARALNWLAFNCFEGDLMWHPFARFYRLPSETIGRFYALRMTTQDRLRILLGRPPAGFGSRWPWGRSAPLAP